MTVTDILAIYAAILSTVVFSWDLFRGRPRIRPRLIPALEDVGGELVSGAHLSIQNVSSHVVHLAHVSLLYRYRSAGLLVGIRHMFRFRKWPRRIGWTHSSLSNYNLSSGCPVALEPWKAHGVFIPDHVLKQILDDAVGNEIRAVVQDELWNDTYSDKLAIDWPGAQPDRETDV